MYIGIHVKYPLLFSDLKETWFLPTDFRRIKYQISLEFVQWKPSFSMRTDRLTDTRMTKPIVALHNFADAPKISRRTFRRTESVSIIKAVSLLCSIIAVHHEHHSAQIMTWYASQCRVSGCYVRRHIVGTNGFEKVKETKWNMKLYAERNGSHRIT